jgi:hypothetical protein
MVQFANFTRDEYNIVLAITDRAVRSNIYDNALAADMDLSAVHVHCPLRLVDLLTADDFNFAHDLSGIRQHINRTTGKLENHFLPRFAVPF